jgi:hypothetical protein
MVWGKCLAVHLVSQHDQLVRVHSPVQFDRGSVVSVRLWNKLVTWLLLHMSSSKKLFLIPICQLPPCTQTWLVGEASRCGGYRPLKGL